MIGWCFVANNWLGMVTNNTVYTNLILHCRFILGQLQIDQNRFGDRISNNNTYMEVKWHKTDLLNIYILFFSLLFIFAISFMPINSVFRIGTKTIELNILHYLWFHHQWCVIDSFSDVKYGEKAVHHQKVCYVSQIDRAKAA